MAKRSKKLSTNQRQLSLQIGISTNVEWHQKRVEQFIGYNPEESQVIKTAQKNTWIFYIHMSPSQINACYRNAVGVAAAYQCIDSNPRCDNVRKAIESLQQDILDCVCNPYKLELHTLFNANENILSKKNVKIGVLDNFCPFLLAFMGGTFVDYISSWIYTTINYDAPIQMAEILMEYIIDAMPRDSGTSVLSKFSRINISISTPFDDIDEAEMLYDEEAHKNEMVEDIMDNEWLVDMTCPHTVELLMEFAHQTNLVLKKMSADGTLTARIKELT